MWGCISRHSSVWYCAYQVLVSEPERDSKWVSETLLSVGVDVIMDKASSFVQLYMHCQVWWGLWSLGFAHGVSS